MKKVHMRTNISSNDNTGLVPVHRTPTVRRREIIAFHREQICWVTSGWMRHWDFFFKDLYEGAGGG